MYLSKLTLLPSPETAQSLLKQYQQDNYSSHQLLWAYFTEHSERTFIYRQEQGKLGLPSFFVLSSTLPKKTAYATEILSRSFTPRLYFGQQLAFKLRANPTVCLTDQNTRKKTRHDVLMHAKHQLGDHYTTQEKQQQMNEAAQNWLNNEKRLASWGMRLVSLSDIETYTQHEAKKHQTTIRFSSVDYQGVLSLTDPEQFLHQYYQGFGRSKAFGCGLMLLQPLN